jgi:glyoxylase-like metal-dependent hydrolase (beta-lactamase superfamily II)
MMNFRIIVSSLLAIGAVLLGAPSQAQGESTSVRMTPQKVAEGVWFVQGESAIGSAANQNFISNAGFVVTDDGVVVIDALGSPGLGRQLIAEIGKITSQPIRTVIVTHYHADHIYGLQAFKAIGATLIAHAAARGYIGSPTAAQRLADSRQELFPWVDESTEVVAPDRWVDRDTDLVVGGTVFHLQHVGPAHTAEDLAVWVESRGVLFSGDLVFRGRIPFVGQADSGAWVASLTQMIQARPRLIVPGHGGTATDPLPDLALTRDYLVTLRASMGEAARNMDPFEDAYARTDWSRFEKIPLFRAVNRMNAYNTYLLMER